MDTIWRIAEEIGHQALVIGSAILRIVITFGVAWVIARLARDRLEPRLARQRYGRDGAMLAGRLISITAYILAFVSVLNQLDVNWTGVLTLLSAFTVAIGLSLQDVLKSFFSGILMLLERPFSVGDRVRVRDYEGEVQGIDIRTTLIRNRDGALIHVPNSIMFGEILTNRSHFRTRRLQLTLKDSARSIADIERTVRSTLERISDVRRPIVQPRIQSITTEGVEMSYSFLVQATPTVDREVMLSLAEALPGAAIEVVES